MCGTFDRILNNIDISRASYILDAFLKSITNAYMREKYQQLKYTHVGYLA